MKILVFDTETSNKERTKFNLYNNYVFDFGAVILDTETGEILLESNFLVSDIYYQPDIMANYYAGEEELARRYNSCGIPVISYSELIDTIEEIIDEYSVDALAAYNITFDKTAIMDTSKLLGYNFTIDKYQYMDIYHMACQALAGNDQYVLFCTENDKVSAKGNISSTAETVYQFIKNDKSFIEAHTALEDSKIEAEILKWVLDVEREKGVVFKRSANTQSWRLVQPRGNK